VQLFNSLCYEYITGNFAECTQRLSDMTLTCNELKVQEQQNCQRAKDRIDKLVKEKETLQEEVYKTDYYKLYLGAVKQVIIHTYFTIHWLIHNIL